MASAPRRRAALAAAAALGLACDEPFRFAGPVQLPVAVVQVRPDSTAVVAGGGLQFVAVLLDSTGDTITDRAATWSTPDLSLAAVSFTGFAQALAPGTARIVARAEGASDTARLTILPLTFTTVAAGDRHTCGLGNNARAYCWGLGSSGQLGVGGTPFLSTVPAPVAGTSGYTLVAAGADHTCALTPESQGECWGANTSSQLGRGGASTDPTRPAPLATAPALLALALGDLHSCGLGADSSALCWGSNVEGQIGDSQGVTRALPTAVAGGHRFTALAAGGFHTCALDAAGAAWCWGANTAGQLGDSSSGSNRRYPVAVHGGLAFTAVAAGGAHSCGALADGRVFCWGDNARGQLGTGASGAGAVVPVEVAPGTGFTAGRLRAGARHTCGLAADSTAWCWGANDRGQLGDSSFTDRATPVAVAGGLAFTALTAGTEHTCGRVSDGAVYCWGAGESGQLGVGAVGDHAAPQPVLLPGTLATGGARAAAVAAGRAPR
jgi:alpha-tubulin suppressor-like RCC1 family protein